MATTPFILEYQDTKGKWHECDRFPDQMMAIKNGEKRLFYFRVRQGKTILVCRPRF